MKLGEWLKAEAMTQDQFAALSGISIASVSRLVRGQQRPDWDTMQKIADATAGAVQPNDFAPEPVETGAGR
jgi:transcriptional regulator with XRE-family HTH domain